jgi:FeS assembly SUF system protein
MTYLPTMTTGGLPEDSPAHEVSQSTADITPDPANMEAIAPKIIEALKTVYDPEIPVDIYELGLIYDIGIEPEGKVAIKMTLTAPGCPVAGTMPQMVEDAIRAKVPGANEVEVELVWDPPWDFSRMSEAARLELNMF